MNYDTSEAPLDKCYLSSYAFTINISPNKYLGCNLKWGKFTETMQRQFLADVIHDAVNELQVDHQYIFEYTKQGNIHAHGYLRCLQPEIEKFQEIVFNKCGFPKVPKHIVCMYSKTEVHIGFWQQYMEKDQEREESEQSDPESPDEPVPEHFMFKNQNTQT